MRRESGILVWQPWCRWLAQCGSEPWWTDDPLSLWRPTGWPNSRTPAQMEHSSITASRESIPYSTRKSQAESAVTRNAHHPTTGRTPCLSPSSEEAEILPFIIRYSISVQLHQQVRSRSITAQLPLLQLCWSTASAVFLTNAPAHRLAPLETCSYSTTVRLVAILFPTSAFASGGRFSWQSNLPHVLPHFVSCEDSLSASLSFSAML